MKMSARSLACQQRVFQRYHFEEFYPQDGGESLLALKLRHCHPLYSTLCRMRRAIKTVAEETSIQPEA